MITLFETKIHYEKIMENGAMKKVTEPYLVDAMSFTEAEAKIIEEMKPYMSGEFSVTAIKRTKISEYFKNENAKKLWLIKVNFISYDEKSGRERKSVNYFLIQADDADSASEILEEEMRDTLADYEIAGINETAYIDVFLKV